MAALKKQLYAQMEQQRMNYDEKIDGLELSLRKCQQTIVKLEGTVLEKDTLLTKKAEVEKQRDTWKAHHDSMEASKQEL